MRCHEEKTATIRRRILDVLPAATFQMHKLLELVEVTLSDASPTACMECGPRPRLHLNPGFVQDYCKTDEHLFMLVMHEMNHLVLGHTRLFEHSDLKANIAFDAVINAMLCHQFPSREYTSFFTSLNEASTLPGCLLRPPEGWIEMREGSTAEVSQFWRDVESTIPSGRLVRQLYGERRRQSVTYLDIFETLRRSRRRMDESEAVLLGDHGPGEGKERSHREDHALENPALKDVLRRIVEKWPPPPHRIAGRDQGRNADPYLLPAAETEDRAARKAITALLARAGVLRGVRSPREVKPTSVATTVDTVLPQWRDRRVSAHRAMWGHAPVYYRSEESEQRWRPVRVPVCHVYVDVSGSMNHFLPALIRSLDQPHRRGQVKAFVFSTVVAEVAPRALAGHRYPNTLGTDIECVLEHYLDIPAKHRPKRVVVFTDGYVGPVSDEARRAVVRLGTRVYVGLTPGGHEKDLEPITFHIEHLPLPR